MESTVTLSLDGATGRGGDGQSPGLGYVWMSNRTDCTSRTDSWEFVVAILRVGTNRFCVCGMTVTPSNELWNPNKQQTVLIEHKRKQSLI